MALSLAPDDVEEQFDFPRLAPFSAYWREHPPVHVSVARIARFIGIRVDAAAAPSSTPAGSAIPASQRAGAILDDLLGGDGAK